MCNISIIISNLCLGKVQKCIQLRSMQAGIFLELITILFDIEKIYHSKKLRQMSNDVNH